MCGKKSERLVPFCLCYMKPVIRIISRGRGSDPETHCPHKKMHSFATMDRFLKFWQLWKAEIQLLRMKCAELTYSRSPMSKIEQGCWRSDFCHFSGSTFFRFWAPKSSPDRFFDSGIFLLQTSRYFPGIPLLRSRIPHLLQKLCNKRCATPPSH